MKVFISTSLNWRICKECRSFKLISFKTFSPKDVSLARMFGLGRFYLPALNEDAGNFWREFKRFWDNVVNNFRPGHPFWRNVVSSKMQPWENSIGYLCLVLFTLNHIPGKEDAKFIILCDSVGMKRVCFDWAEIHGWEIINTGARKGSLWARLEERMNNFSWFFARFVFCLYKKALSPKKTLVSTPQASVLISSFFYPDSFRDGSYYDPFFGRLHQYIKKQGLECVYFCEPLNVFNQAVAQKVSRCRDITVYTPYSLLGWKDLFRIVAGLYFRRINIPRCLFMGCDFSGFIRWHAASFRDSYNLTAELYFAAVNKLCKKYKFKRLIYSAEGNVHERACIQAFRKSNRGSIIGYSHAVIYPLNIKIRLSDKEAVFKPGPDFYVCTGPYSKKLLKRIGGGYPSFKLRDGCVFKEIPVIKDRNESQNDNRNILIALDGMNSSIVLLEWVLEHAEALKGFKVYVRFHPNISANRILSQCINRFPDNFKISDKDLTQDIESSLCVLYRHSSVGMQAILNGVPAIHLAIDSPLSGDPVEKLTDYKWTVSSSQELVSAIRGIKSLESKQKDTLWNSAVNFLKDYFAVPDENSLKDFIS